MDSAFAAIDTTIKAAAGTSPFWQNFLLELLKNPGIFWVILASIVTALFYKPLRYQLLPTLGGLKVMGVEFSFVQASITHTFTEVAEKSDKFPQVITTEEEQRRVIDRVRKNTGLFRGTRILWIDDDPDTLMKERTMLQSLLVDIDLAKSSAAADKMLQAKHKKYFVILSDMKRNDDSEAGLKFLDNYAKQKNRVPVIFYIGHPDLAQGVPPHAFGITHRPDELLHLIMDALERAKP